MHCCYALLWATGRDRDHDGSEADTAAKRSFSDAFQALGEGDEIESAAVDERFFPDLRDAGGKFDDGRTAGVFYDGCGIVGDLVFKSQFFQFLCKFFT